MKPDERDTRRSYFAPAWFLGRHASMYVARYARTETRRPRPDGGDRRGSGSGRAGGSMT